MQTTTQVIIHRDSNRGVSAYLSAPLIVEDVTSWIRDNGFIRINTDRTTFLVREEDVAMMKVCQVQKT